MNGNLASTVEPRGNLPGCGCASAFTTSYTYDAAGRLLTTTGPDPDGPGPLGPIVTTDAYDKVGNLLTITDPNGHVTSYTHDYAGRILTVTAPDPDGGGPKTAPVTTYTYDAAGNQLTRKDANNHTTTTGYDALNRPMTVTSPDPDGGGSQTPSVATMAYDISGNLLTVTDANGNNTPAPGDGTTTYGYDRANRLTSINYSDTTPDVTFVLDNAGNRTSTSDGSGAETRGYDQMERLTTITRSGSSFAYVYDSASNVTKRTYPDGTVVDYTYDPLNRMATVTSGGKTTAYAYDAASNVVTTTLPAANGYVETRSYDNAGRLNQVKHQKGAGVLADITYTRDQVGNPLTETRTGTSPVTKTFTYDQLDRLTGVCFQTGTCPGGGDPFIRWDYDGVGNRLSEQRPTGTTSYTYDQMDRMLTAGATSYTYDRNGNQLSAGSRTFTWDLTNRLKSTTASGTTTTYSYDGDGKRLQASTGSGATRKRTSPGTPTTGCQCSSARRAATTASCAGMSTGSAGRCSCRPRARTRSTTSQTASAPAQRHRHRRRHPAHLRLRAIRDGQDPERDARQLREFAPGSTKSDRPLPLRARQQDPQAGRFLSPDPGNQTVGGGSIAAYVYAGNRPTLMTDLTGEVFCASRAHVAAAATASSGVAPTDGAPECDAIGSDDEGSAASLRSLQSLCRSCMPNVLAAGPIGERVGRPPIRGWRYKTAPPRAGTAPQRLAYAPRVGQRVRDDGVGKNREASPHYFTEEKTLEIITNARPMTRLNDAYTQYNQTYSPSRCLERKDWRLRGGRVLVRVSLLCDAPLLPSQLGNTLGSRSDIRFELLRDNSRDRGRRGYADTPLFGCDGGGLARADRGDLSRRSAAMGRTVHSRNGNWLVSDRIVVTPQPRRDSRMLVGAGIPDKCVRHGRMAPARRRTSRDARPTGEERCGRSRWGLQQACCVWGRRSEMAHTRPVVGRSLRPRGGRGRASRPRLGAPDDASVPFRVDLSTGDARGGANPQLGGLMPL